MKKRVLVLLLALVVCLILPMPALANSAEPPRLSVLVENPPEDLALSLVFTRGDEREPVTAHATRLAWEGYYLFRPASFPSFWDTANGEPYTVELLAETGGESFTIPIDAQTLSQNTGSYYNNLCVLNLQARTLTAGAPWWRQPVLVCLRLALTLVIEGLVFLLCGYRTKRSWLVFLCTNLVTQLFVNLAILFLAGPFGNMHAVGQVFLFIYLPMEVLVLVVEIIAYRKLLREKDKLTATISAIAANLLSWLLGGLLLTYLPL